MPTPVQGGSPGKVADDARPVGPVTRRLIYALVLIPIVPAVSGIGTIAYTTYLGTGQFDEFRWFTLLFSLLWVAGTIVIWRSVILWTLGRRWLTALVGLIPFVQVAHAKPLWSVTGCWARPRMSTI